MHKEKLTVRLPKENLDFVKHYAVAHHTTVTDIINRYLENLRRQHSSIDPEVERISGLVPAHVDTVRMYHDALIAKHQ